MVLACGRLRRLARSPGRFLGLHVRPAGSGAPIALATEECVSAAPLRALELASAAATVAEVGAAGDAAGDAVEASSALRLEATSVWDH